MPREPCCTCHLCKPSRLGSGGKHDLGARPLVQNQDPAETAGNPRISALSKACRRWCALPSHPQEMW
eukprot:8763914-Pyramimonas_sp.AAC.1